jgi:hypothetical protein
MYFFRSIVIMQNELTTLVENIWQSSDKERAAIKSDQMMSDGARDRLHEIMYDLTQGIEEPAPPELPKRDSEEMSFDARALLLIMLCWHHSDSLAYLPFEKLEKRFAEWASWTGLPLEVVRRAASLGPAGLSKLCQHEPSPHH